MSHQLNITRIKAVYDALEEMASDVIFICGATVSLYIDRPSGETRPTDDVDILVELAHYTHYAAFVEKLRKKGLINDLESGVICRYKINEITVEVMPTSEKILGFANRWYAEAFSLAMDVYLDDDYKIKILSSPYLSRQNWKYIKTGGKMMEEQVLTLRILSLF